LYLEEEDDAVAALLLATDVVSLEVTFREVPKNPDSDC
jgi:hypothetical protein